MKKILNIALAAAMLTLACACNKVLDEQPRTFYEPGFFKTEAGVQGGLTSLYRSLRLVYGQGYYFNSLETGTDEYTYGWSADNNFKDADLSGVGSLTPSSCRSEVLWNMAFGTINTANGIIENATESGLDAQYIAEAKFFRAFFYFQLVKTFGGVPLDLGAGELKFNSIPSRVSVRNTVPEVNDKIFADLVDAEKDLPATDRMTGTATKTAARLVLAQAYLTYAWWLENPKGIPTYPECSRDASEASSYFQKAYDTALAAINDPGPFALQETFRDVSLGPNDRNSEIVLYADHNNISEQYNESSFGWSNGNAPENFVGWFVIWNYSGDMKIRYKLCDDDDDKKTFNPVQREAVQALGRPWTRMAPTVEALRKFADDRDSRRDGTFTTVFRANWVRGGEKTESAIGANNLPVHMGEPILTFLFNETEDNTINYRVSKDDKEQALIGAAIGAGEKAGRSDFVYDINHINRRVYPAIWKHGPYRTDNDGTGLGSPNGASTRPFNILKFSELYFIAAEAAVKGASGAKSAKDLLSVIVKRAGKWNYSNAEDAAVEADYGDALVADMPSAITIDYILDERMREYFADGIRWFDLARTQTWAERAGKYTIANSYEAPTEHTRTIDNFMYLRPIPQTQINGLVMDEADKKAYQNPGYPTE